MSPNDNAIAVPRVTFSSIDGPLFASLGVLCFSLSLTATRAALGSFGSLGVGAGRAVIAAVFAAIWLYSAGARRPSRAELRALAKVALGVVVGFPVLSAIAMREVSATHGSVVFSVTPALTAVFAALLGGERPSRRFWVASAIATVCAVLVGLSRSHGALSRGDALLLVAVVLVAMGYAEGGRLARVMSGPAVICWALLVALPVTLPLTAWAITHEARPGPVTAQAILGLGYVSIVSMLLGFFAWYRGLAKLGVARASQLQLAQGPLGALWSHRLLGEAFSPVYALSFVVVISCAIVAAQSRVQRR